MWIDDTQETNIGQMKLYKQELERSLLLPLNGCLMSFTSSTILPHFLCWLQKLMPRMKCAYFLVSSFVKCQGLRTLLFNNVLSR
jgi:hypothetical protein